MRKSYDRARSSETHRGDRKRPSLPEEVFPADRKIVSECVRARVCVTRKERYSANEIEKRSVG